MPEEVSRNFSIVENLMDLVSSTNPGTVVRKLNMELQCTYDHLKLWRDVIRSMTLLVKSIMKTFFSGGRHTIQTCAVCAKKQNCSLLIQNYTRYQTKL